MIDFSKAQLMHFAIHFVGNKSLGEELTLSNKAIKFKDDFIKETVLRYFLSPFKTDIYYQFKGKTDFSLNSLANVCEDLFASTENFIEQSKLVATHLFVDKRLQGFVSHTPQQKKWHINCDYLL